MKNKRQYIVKVIRCEGKPYFLACDDMDFYPVTSSKNACKFDTLEEVELTLDLWLNEQEKAVIIEVEK